MTEQINGQQNYEKQTANDEKKPNYLLRRGLALTALSGLLATGGALLYEGANRSDKQLEIEQQPSLQDQIFDAIENYDENDPQIQYEIAADSNISKQAEDAAKLLHENDEHLTYAENHQGIALTAANLAARDIEAITGRGVRAGDLITTWYDADIGSFVTAATEALPAED